MMLKCAVLDDYQKCASGLADWSRIAGLVNVEFFHKNIASEKRLVEMLLPYDIIVAMRERTPFSSAILRQLPQLKLLVTTGMRNAAIDLEAAAERGIVVSGTEGTGQATSELTIGLMLASVRHLPTEFANMREGRWQTTVGVGLQGLRLGIIGLGRIGNQVATVAKALGMQVSAWSQNLTEQKCAVVGVDCAESLDHLLVMSDIVSIHTQLSSHTIGLIGENELRRMKPSAILINTSRALIVEQQALATALRERWIASAAVDVYETEPLPANHPFRFIPNLVATPHLGYVAEDNLRSNFSMAVENIEAWLAGSSIRIIEQLQ